MRENSNSVNIKDRRLAYHHGNLQDALVTAGLEVLRSRDSDDISLREVARTVGVSATSVYRHFPNKQALIDALCIKGCEMLAAVQRKAMASAGGGQAGFDASGLAYVRFALANPTLFRLMTRTPPTDKGFGGNEDPAIQEVLTNAATLLPVGATDHQRQVRALHAWSLVHGITMLVLEGRFPDDDEMIKAVIRTPS